MIDLSKVIFFWSKIFHHDREHMFVVGHRLPAVNVAELSLLQRQQLVQPVVKLILGVVHDGHAVVEGVERDHELVARVPRVQLAVDVEALLEHDGTFRSRFGLPLALVVVVLEPGGGGGRSAHQHEPFLLVRLQFLQRRGANDRSILHQNPRVPRRTLLLKYFIQLMFETASNEIDM